MFHLRILWVTIGAFLLAMQIDLAAQEKQKNVAAFGGGITPDRAETRILYWDSGKNASVGEFAITYGRPKWKADYQKQMEQLKGKTWRFGKDFWTVLDTNLGLSVAGHLVEVGSYYLGLYRSQEGSTWSLAFYDPSAVRKDRLDAFEIDQASPAFRVPLNYESGDKASDIFTISLTYHKEDPTDVSLKVQWGKHILSAPIKVHLE